jgi:hypothetical protein
VRLERDEAPTEPLALWADNVGLAGDSAPPAQRALAASCDLLALVHPGAVEPRAW